MKPKVLLACEKLLHPLDPNCKTITGADHALAGSLIGSNLADVEVVYWDDFFWTHRVPANEHIYKRFAEWKPDLFVLSCLQMQTFDAMGCLRVANELKIPVAYMCWDSQSPFNKSVTSLFMPYLDLVICIDVTDEPKDRYVSLWNSHDPALFHDPGTERDIDVSFLGTQNPSFVERNNYLKFLADNGIEVFNRHGLNAPDLVSIEEYVRVYQRTKIALSFTWHPDMKAHQAKGRTYEVTRCGAMLLETNNPHTAKRFVPYVEYVPFDGEKDLIDKVRYYLEHDDERKKIAAAGYKKVSECYNNVIFWQTVMDRLGVKYEKN